MKIEHFKGYLCIMTALVIVGRVLTVHASENNGLKSQGVISAEGVVFDAADFSTLQEAITIGKEESYVEGFNAARPTMLSGIVDMTIYTDRYSELTEDDFVITYTVTNRWSGTGVTWDGAQPQIQDKFTFIYNPESGVLDLSSQEYYKQDSSRDNAFWWSYNNVQAVWLGTIGGK